MRFLTVRLCSIATALVLTTIVLSGRVGDIQTHPEGATAAAPKPLPPPTNAAWVALTQHRDQQSGKTTFRILSSNGLVHFRGTTQTTVPDTGNGFCRLQFTAPGLNVKNSALVWTAFPNPTGDNVKVEPDPDAANETNALRVTFPAESKVSIVAYYR
jgi:hypothetical protein